MIQRDNFVSFYWDNLGAKNNRLNERWADLVREREGAIFLEHFG